MVPANSQIQVQREVQIANSSTAESAHRKLKYSGKYAQSTAESTAESTPENVLENTQDVPRGLRFFSVFLFLYLFCTSRGKVQKIPKRETPNRLGIKISRWVLFAEIFLKNENTRRQVAVSVCMYACVYNVVLSVGTV